MKYILNKSELSVLSGLYESLVNSLVKKLKNMNNILLSFVGLVRSLSTWRAASHSRLITKFFTQIYESAASRTH